MCFKKFSRDGMLQNASSDGEEYQLDSNEEVSLVDGVLEGALGALGDGIWKVWVMEFLCHLGYSTNNCFGGMMSIFGLLESLEMESLVEAYEGVGFVDDEWKEMVELV
ncbi:hypothetical protein Tco_0389128 [Tanacetum coccineum]